MDPPQDTAELCLGEACSWMSKILDNRVVRGGKSLKTARIPRREKKEVGRYDPGNRLEILLQPGEMPRKLQVYPEGTAAHEKDSCWKRGELWRGRSGREEPLGTDHNPQFPILLCCLQGDGKEGTGSKSMGVKRKKSVVLIHCFVPYYWNIL